MQLRTARLGRVLKFSAQCNSLTYGLPVYVPIVAGRSYAIMRLVKDPFKKDTSRKNNGQLKYTHKPREWAEFTLDDVPLRKDLKAMIQHPAALTHSACTGDARPGAGILRLSVGLEAPEDVIADLRQALAR